MTGAQWVLPSDVPVDPTAFSEIADQLWADEKLREQILEQDTGTAPHSFDNAVDDRGIPYDFGAEDYWYFFGKDGPSSRTKAFAATVAMVERRLGRSLRKDE